MHYAGTAKKERTAQQIKKKLMRRIQQFLQTVLLMFKQG